MMISQVSAQRATCVLIELLADRLAGTVAAWCRPPRQPAPLPFGAMQVWSRPGLGSGHHAAWPARQGRPVVQPFLLRPCPACCRSPAGGLPRPLAPPSTGFDPTLLRLALSPPTRAGILGDEDEEEDEGWETASTDSGRGGEHQEQQAGPAAAQQQQDQLLPQPPQQQEQGAGGGGAGGVLPPQQQEQQQAPGGS